MSNIYPTPTSHLIALRLTLSLRKGFLNLNCFPFNCSLKSLFSGGFILLIVLLSLPNQIKSQCWEGINHLNYATDLKNVNSIVQSQNGTIWFGTDNGIASLDTLFQLQEFVATSQGKMLGKVKDIAEDSNGKLWIASSSGLFTKLNNEWEYFGPDNSPMPTGDLTAIVISSDGKVWIGTAGSGLITYNCGSWEIINKSNSSLPSDQINDIERQGIIFNWFATDSGIAKFDGDDWVVYNPDNSDLQDWKVNKIQFATLSGALYCGTESNGINIFNGTWTYINTGNSDLPSNKISALYIFSVESETVIQIGTDNGYAVMNAAAEMTVYTSTNSPMKSNRLVLYMVSPLPDLLPLIQMMYLKYQ